MNASAAFQNQPTPDKSPSVATQNALKDAVREVMTKRITASMTAAIVANPSFPREDLLPKVSPAPFTNHGHMLLLDYGSMLKTVWQLVDKIQIAVRGLARRRKRIIFGSLFLAGAVAVVIGSFGSEYLILGIVVGGISLPVFYQLGKWRFITPLRSTIADIRANAVRELLDDRVQSIRVSKEIDEEVEAESRSVGDGRLGQSNVPVLTITGDGHPFPGYGRLQVDNVYVCPPKERKLLPSTVADLRNEISRSIRSFVETSGIGDTSFGEVLVLYGRSLTADNPLLRERTVGEKVPSLWYEAAKLDELDSGADLYARVYFAVQILFPQHMTVATFFTRPFLAGNAVGYQVAMSTLGPPVENVGNLMVRLKQHELEKSGGILATSAYGTSGLGHLRALRSIVRSGPLFQSALIDESAIERLLIGPSADEKGSFQQEIRQLASESVFWAGNYTEARNWREDNSLTFTTHFFGRPEAQASVRTLYVQISKAILDGLDLLGYDISAYRDDKGSYSINADKIDQLVVGEKVYVREQQRDTTAQKESEPAIARKM